MQLAAASWAYHGWSADADDDVAVASDIGKPHALDANGVALPSAVFGRDGESFRVQCDPLAFGTSLQKVVLMAPGSTTHHNDMCQRYHQLVVSPMAGDLIKFSLPDSDRELPSGFYMLFVVDNQNVPSKSIWIQLTAL